MLRSCIKDLLLLWYFVQLFAGVPGYNLASIANAHSPVDDSSTNDTHTYISEEHRLLKTLMDNYETSVRPVSNPSETLHVKFGFSLISIDYLHEKTQVFSASGTMIVEWRDIQLVWDPNEFGGLQKVRLPIAGLWYPEIAIANSKYVYSSLPIHHLATVDSDGRVLWFPPLNLDTHCAVDLSEFPFDEQQCPVNFVWPNHDETQVNITIMDNARDVLTAKNFIRSNEWDLKEITISRNSFQYPFSDEIYPGVTYNFPLRRISTFSTHLFRGPSVILCLVTQTVFLLPPGNGGKMVIGIGVVIGDILLLGELINFVPSAHPSVPLLAKFLVGNIVLASLSVVISAILVGFWDRSSSRISGPNAFFRTFFLGPVAKVLCVRKEDYLPLEEDTNNGITLDTAQDGDGGLEGVSGIEPGEERKRRSINTYLRNAARSEWRQLAVVFDHLFFLVYCVILCILILCFTRYL